MNWMAITTTLISAWAVLRILGGERQRLIQELPPEPEPVAEAPPPPGATPPPSPAKAGKPAPANRKPR